MQSDFEMLAGETTQQLKTLSLLAKDQSSIPAPTSRGRQISVSPDPQDTTHSNDFGGHPHTCEYPHNRYTLPCIKLKIYFFKKKKKKKYSSDTIFGHIQGRGNI